MQRIQSMIRYMAALHLQPHVLIRINFMTSSAQEENMLLHVERKFRVSLVVQCRRFADP